MRYVDQLIHVAHSFLKMKRPRHMTTSSTFVTADTDATKWSNLEPLYRSLIGREPKCEGCLEKLLLDRSDLDALVSEAGANLYITMTRHTDDESANSGYERFVQEVAPEHKKSSFELDKKICDSPHAEKLDQDRYGVMLRETRTSVGMFREENIPIQTELALRAAVRAAHGTPRPAGGVHTREAGHSSL